jgi:hypothetical protein
MINAVRIIFNTGRMYTEEGQTIIAHYQPETGVVRFTDFSRGISGEGKIEAGLKFMENIAKETVYLYDNGPRGGLVYSHANDAPKWGEWDKVAYCPQQR